MLGAACERLEMRSRRQVNYVVEHGAVVDAKGLLKNGRRGGCGRSDAAVKPT